MDNPFAHFGISLVAVEKIVIINLISETKWNSGYF